LLKKNATFEWTEAHDAAFLKLKTAMTSAPICLCIPHWNEPIALISDSSRVGYEFIISNIDKQDVHRVIAYGGRQWNNHESQWSVSELELAGILYALESNSQYFIGRHFKIFTDHISNTWVQNFKHSQGKLYRWSLRLQSYSFDIEHVSGAHMPADFLGRSVEKVDETAADLDDDSALVFAIDDVSYPEPVVTPKFMRPHERSGRKRQNTVITLLACHETVGHTGSLSHQPKATLSSVLDHLPIPASFETSLCANAATFNHKTAGKAVPLQSTQSGVQRHLFHHRILSASVQAFTYVLLRLPQLRRRL